MFPHTDLFHLPTPEFLKLQLHLYCHLNGKHLQVTLEEYAIYANNDNVHV